MQSQPPAISMAVPSGSVFGFLGPNGAGKTTTIRRNLCDDCAWGHVDWHRVKKPDVLFL